VNDINGSHLQLGRLISGFNNLLRCGLGNRSRGPPQSLRRGLFSWKKNLVSCSSRKQSTPSVSGCEAEYVSLFEAGRDAVWIRSLMCELGLCPGSILTKLLHDNQGSIAWAEGGIRKFKHVELKSHHSQYLISTGQIKISYVASALNAADCMTKALTWTFFQKSLQFLNIA
jgi:hypothetical protein